MMDDPAKILKEEQLRSQIMELVAEYHKLAHQPGSFVPGITPVPVSGKVYGAEEMQNLVDSALDFWLTTGRFNEAFEQRLSRILGVAHSVTVNSGSSANLLAVTALTSHLFGDRALKAGDEVITCATGFPTTVNPLLQNGLTPVFVDVDIPTYNMKVGILEEALSERTRAIVLAHTLVNPFDLETVVAFAKKHGLWLVEDCCDALGARYGGQTVGTFGDIGTLSFYPAHQITMGEGGAVYMNSRQTKRAVESFRDWGRDCWCEPGKDNTCKQRFEWQLGNLPKGYDHKYTYSHLGYNLKITDMQAAVGLAQLDRIEGFLLARRKNFDSLRKGLSDLEEYFVLPEPTPNSEPSWFGFTITVREDAPFTRDDITIHLNQKKIATRLLFGGNLVRQPYMAEHAFRIVGDLANSDRVMRDTFWIGLFPGISADAIAYMLEIIHAYCQGNGTG